MILGYLSIGAEASGSFLDMFQSMTNTTATETKIANRELAAQHLQMQGQNMSFQAEADAGGSFLDMFQSMTDAIVKNAMTFPANQQVPAAPEVMMQAEADTPTKVNKVILGLLCGLFGCCGAHHCFLGQTCLGIVQALTLGGVGIWALIDYVHIMSNCLSRYTSISGLGINAEFDPSTVDGAFWVGAVFVGLGLLSCVCRCVASISQSGGSGPQQQ